ncbi:ABC transporter [Pandoraea cepalis]|uniref:Cyclolysin secretion/processing ATP-binding protein CyaB n=1 Tax=Pandoraea cepalis TaxID=2508294 RepID=A0AAW7MT71_9BURK|nr:peptidase domain-containing ABC transporter [Pandoraea cepalis]MDN4575997.1 ABC transporter [Pandoraea cepalis]MDN4581099.1 ABC transporter [Pandoraea cepalis]
MTKWRDFDVFSREPVPTILQTEAAECGLACLAMIAGRYGRCVDLQSLRARFPVSPRGATLASVVSIARCLQLASRAVSLELDALGKLRLPCILHWNFDHFVVLVRVSARDVIIHDPAQGRKTIALSEVSKCFTGVALELWPGTDFVVCDERQEIRIGHLLGNITGLTASMAQLVALAVSLEIFVLVSPFYLQWVVDHALLTADRDLLITLALGFSLVLVCQHATGALRSWSLMRLGVMWNLQWRANLFAHMVRLPVSYFVKRHLGDVLSRFGAVDEIQRTLTTSFVEAGLDGLMAGLTLILIFVYSPVLGVVVLAFVAVYALLRLVLHRPIFRATEAHLVQASRQQSHFLETLRGIRTIKLFSREDERQLHWLTLLVQQVNADIRIQKMTLLNRHANGFLTGAENIVVIWIAAMLVIGGELTVGALIAFLAYKTQFQARVTSLIDKLAEFKMLGVQAARLADIALHPPETSGDAVSSAAPHVDARLDVEGLSFRHSEHEPCVLENISFSVAAGESVAIVGASGSGKSTLMHLILGILVPCAGTISLGGMALHTMGAHRLRRAVGAVMQDDILFAGSLLDNICLFDTKADAGWIRECARVACVADDIEAMPMGYNTLVGDMGGVLSGGQKQRILLARALYKRPSILLLDEATSHLDVENERRVNAAIDSLHMTRVIIAHRPQTIASVERVIEIRGGTIVSDRRHSHRPSRLAEVRADS